MSAPRLLVHCGLHKTGTTALQWSLLSAAPSLRGLGVLYPKAGRLDRFGGGHHNLAWELARDRRYRRELGGIDALVEEIAGFDGDILLSSEDFESVLDRPERLTPLIRNPGLRGRRVTLLIYVRDQIAYAESLFLELLKHGFFAEECLPTMREILEHPVLRRHEWRYQFDYQAMLERLRQVPDVEVAVRSYGALGGRGIVADALAMLLPGAELAEHPAFSATVNASIGLGEALALFHATRVARSMTMAEVTATWLLQRAQSSGRLMLPRALRAGFRKRFDAGNAAFCQAAGLPRTALDLDALVGPPPLGAAFMDRVFSFETQMAIAALAPMIPHGLVPGPQPFVPRTTLPDAAQDLIARVVQAWQDERLPT